MSREYITIRIGEQAGPFTETITAERLARFRAAVGLSAGGMPPTFLTRFRVGEFEIFKRLAIPLSSVLHAEQAYAYDQPLLDGDEVRYETTLTQVAEKKGGTGPFTMSFLTLETRFLAARGRTEVPIGMSRTVVVVRRPRPLPEAPGGTA